MLYSQYLYSQQDKLKASQQLDRALPYAKDNGVTHYNLGLHYFDQGLYEKARGQAHTALTLGVTQTGLREQLSKVGQWREPAAATE
jgi:tetratricopeptide (TPR) repeat protein